MNPRNIDLVIQYALAVASEADDFKDRELGPIHLIKYVYLADLAHSRSGEGSFTGVPWRFHHFGPWAVEVFERVAPAAQAIGAQERGFPSRFREQDAFRWHVRESHLAEKLERGLPWAVSRAVRQAVMKYHNDTTALLHDVYKTAPMMNAAPGETLALVPPSDETALGEAPSEVTASTPLPELSRRKVKELQTFVKQRSQENRRGRTLVAPEPLPRYDEVFLRGQEWLDQQAGEPIRQEHGRIEFSDSVWKSPGRRDPEIP
jgi:hypothetical protein